MGTKEADAQTEGLFLGALFEELQRIAGVLLGDVDPFAFGVLDPMFAEIELGNIETVLGRLADAVLADVARIIAVRFENAGGRFARTLLSTTNPGSW